MPCAPSTLTPPCGSSRSPGPGAASAPGRRCRPTGRRRAPCTPAPTWCGRCSASRTPVVALVNGVAAGIGVPMVLACDYVLASDAASFVLAFARIGLMPDGGSTALVAASIGRARAMRLALTGEKLDAVTAADWGLVAECVAAQEFPARGEAVLAAFAGGATLALGETKAAVNAASVDVEAALAPRGGGADRPDAHRRLPRGRRRLPRQATGGLHRPLSGPPGPSPSAASRIVDVHQSVEPLI